MKTEQLEIVTPLELKRAVAEIIAAEGSQEAAAAKMGARQSNISQLMNGRYYGTTRKIAAFFGLECRRVFVKKNKKGTE